MVEGGMKCIKYLLFAFNLIFFITGIALITVGVLVKTKFKDYENFTGSEYASSAILLIAIGVIIFIIAFFGCCGAVKESFCMVMTFAVLLGLIFVLELAAGIAGYLLRDDIEKVLNKELTKDLTRWKSGHDKGFTKAWDVMQTDLKCCGVNSSADWAKNNDHFKLHNGTEPTAKFPDSCCMDGNVALCAESPGVSPYPDGCLNKLKDVLSDNAVKVGAVGIGIAFVQVVGVILACCLARAIKREYEVV